MAYGDGSFSFDHRGTACKDKRHRNCTGRWVGAFMHEGKRYAVTSARSKAECAEKMKNRRAELESNLTPVNGYTVAEAVADWLKDGLPGRSAETIRNATEITRALLASRSLGTVKLKKLTGDDVRIALTDYAATRSQSTVSNAHGCLNRAIKFAQSRRKVADNMAALVEIPEGRSGGRPSKSLTLEQMLAILHASVGTAMDAYIHLSLLTGVRTEEARALHWSEVELDGDEPGVDVVRSVRRKGETKTRTSRRGLELPQAAVEALRRHKAAQDKGRAAAGSLWVERGLVFTDALGRPLTDRTVVKLFREVLETVPGIDAAGWTPREMRHTFTSVLDLHDVPTAEISRLLGHSRVATTETVYRHELRVRRQAGARAMDNIVPIRKLA